MELPGLVPVHPERGGYKLGDVIVELNGVPIHNQMDLFRTLDSLQVIQHESKMFFSHRDIFFFFSTCTQTPFIFLLFVFLWVYLLLQIVPKHRICGFPLTLVCVWLGG
jgi:hypothetical protein